MGGDSPWISLKDLSVAPIGPGATSPLCSNVEWNSDREKPTHTHTDAHLHPKHQTKPNTNIATMGQPSFAASNALVYVTYGVFL